MNDYVIFTDSACDIEPSMLNDWGVKFCCLTFAFEGDDKQYNNFDIPSKDFYQMMREGRSAKTSAANVDEFKTAFEEFLKQGTDVLYLGFSSGLSTTYNSARLAAEELLEIYRDRKIITVDTLAASAGFGLILNLTIKEKEKGATIEQAAQFAEDIKLKMCHWFTVDDLVYLKRGGRISPTVAFVGGLLGIKPVLHMDDEGHLVNMFKVRGRTAAINALADKFGELSIDNTSGPVYICHADCMADAEKLSSIIENKYGVKTELTVNVGPVIGAHSGPGTLAVFFLGKER